uniref:phosphatidylinositol-3,5-bisphosphate 3-phosphatase n=1 Tax=Strongyloides papillosus TaxID=174720 RepID=A0A0N5B465_STREA
MNTGESQSFIIEENNTNNLVARVPTAQDRKTPTYPTTEILPWALPGESLQKKEKNICCITYYIKSRGVVYVTNYRVHFESDEAPEDSFFFLLGNVARIEKFGFSSNTTRSNVYGIEICLKDQRKIKFAYPKQSVVRHIRRDFYQILHKMAFPISYNLPFFATIYRSIVSYELDCWNLYNPEAEYSRFGVPNNDWALCHINQNYTFCSSYPALLYVPKISIDNNYEFLNKIANSRSSRRIPVLSWMNSKTSAAIVRSSQPLVGFKLSKKYTDDEKYLQQIASTNHNGLWKLNIIDARPHANAQANRAKGGGFENYESCSLEFMDIQNIHAVRELIKKCRDVCAEYPEHEKLKDIVESTKWLSYIRSILRASEAVVNLVHDEKKTVLVHCSDGWDRTAQITSIAMLMMDPYYRTINGFAILIEKEWCSFGHKFSHRCGHGVDKPNDSERSPIFLQFLECVWQIYNNYSSYFEFNDRYLLFLADELYSCRFGTFLFNNECERIKEHHCPNTTVSIWTHIYNNYKDFVNEKYNHNLSTTGDSNSTLKILDYNKPLDVWRAYYSGPALESLEKLKEKRERLERESEEKNINNFSRKKSSFDASSDDNSSYSLVEVEDADDALCREFKRQNISFNISPSLNSNDYKNHHSNNHSTIVLYEGHSTFHKQSSPAIIPTRPAPPRPTPPRPSPPKLSTSNINAVKFSKITEASSND